MKFSLMNLAVSSSPYDSASSRAHAPQAGAALKSMSNGSFLDLASESAASASLFHLTSMYLSSDAKPTQEGLGWGKVRGFGVMTETLRSVKISGQGIAQLR
jgi:hypothetical protein